MANTDPILTSEGAEGRGFWNKGSLQVDGALVLPTVDTEFTNPDLRDSGKIRYNDVDGKAEIFNGTEWTSLNQDLQEVLNEGSTADILNSIIIDKDVSFSDSVLIKVGGGTTTDLYNTLGVSEEITGTGNYNALNGEARGTASADNTGRVRGGKFVSLVDPNGFSYNNTGGGSMGSEGVARVVGAGTVLVATGIYARVLADVSGAIITNAVALNAPQPFAATGASIVNAMGVHITEQNVTNVTNSFNMVVGNPGGGGTIAPVGVTGNYSIYNLSDYYNYFKQRLGLGTDAPTEMLHVVGKAIVTSAPTNPTDVVRKTELDLKANDNSVVHTTGNETIGGTKTFSLPFVITGGSAGDLLLGTGASTNGNTFVRGRQVSGSVGDNTPVATGTTFNDGMFRLQTQVNERALKVGADDIEITDTTKGIILKSPDGTRYRITVANGGTLNVNAV